MDEATLRDVTRALDRAIARSAEARLKFLAKSSDSRKTAERIVGALRSLKLLQDGGKPQYDAWCAVFYALWYQPGQINLAYTLARSLLKEMRDRDSLLRLDEGWHLQVDDLGCGTGATQFGVALAMTSLQHGSQSFPAVTMKPEDESPSMKAMGEMIWRAFVADSRGDVERACLAVGKRPPATQGLRQEAWLTAFHSFYQEDDQFRTVAFPRQVEDKSPDFVIVSTQGKSGNYLPDIPSGYRIHVAPRSLELSGGGEFTEIDDLRARIFERYVQGSGLRGQDHRFAEAYLTKLPVNWVTNAVKDCALRCYCRVSGERDGG